MLLLTYPTQGISVRDFLPKVIVLFCILISSLSEAQVTQDDVPIDSLENLFCNESDVVDKQRLLKALMLEASKLNAEEYYGLCPKLEKYAEEIEDNYARAVINRKKGELLYQQAEYTKAVEYFSKATEIYLSLDSLRAGYLSKLKIGVMFEKSGKPKEAFNIYHDVLKLSQNDSLIESRADANNQLGVHYFYRREIDSSRFYYEQSLELYERQLDSSGIASCLNNLGINYFMNGEVDRSEETFLKLKSLHEAQGNERQLVMVLQNLGNLNIEIANLEKALQYSTEAYNIAIKNKCKNCLPTILGGIGNIYIKTGDYEAAYNFLLTAEKSVPEVDYDSRVVFLATKGQILKGLERYDEAVATLKESIAIVTEKKVQVQRAVELKVLLASALYDIGDIAQTKNVMNELKLKEISSPVDAAHVDYMKTKLLYHDGDYQGVIRLGEPTYQKLQTYKKTRLSYRLSEILSSAYEKTNNYRKALSYNRKYQVLNDSLNNVEKVKLLTRKTKDFEFELEKKELAAEQVKNEAVLEEEAKQSKMLASSIGLFAILISFFFYKNNQQKKLIAEKNLKLTALNNTKDQIFSIIGHDLKKPVLAFRGLHDKFSYLIESKDHEKLLKFSQSIDADAVQLNKLTDNLLSWALLQKDVLQIQAQSVNLKEIVEEVIQLFQPFAISKSISISHTIADVEIQSDKHALSIIIRNLVDNAIKYTSNGGEVRLYTKQDDAKIQLIVEDTGQGISRDKINDLFVLAKGKSTAGTQDEKGTGLGLHIVKELIEKCQGQIQVDSQLGEGSVFTLSIPVG